MSSPIPTAPSASSAAAPSAGAPSADAPAAPPVLAEIVRSGFVEGYHRGSMVVTAADGSVDYALGDVDSPIFPRSCNKPLQAAAVLRAGLDLGGERLALAAASHSGEPFQLELVERMLAEHGLRAEQLRCPEDLPLDREEADRRLAAGHSASRVAMNCSGKHTAMLAACLHNGWPLDSYLDPAHPLQRSTVETVEQAAGEPVAHIGVDGCGAPLMAISLTGLARAFRTLVTSPAGSAERRVADAMRAHPEYVAGTRRHDTALMRAVPGALAKMGAEAVQAVALADGRALAFKIEDGGTRALGPVLAAALRRHLAVDSGLPETLPLLGGGRPVGEVRAVR
ncbi:asparaginase [Streptomyces sp. XM4193]|uniref:asparaginase n=1 Tax=Streptomyces sp. XM4193 TaxID=2929782 RepID=UPI001FF9EA0F|nr:asparaginase [Streptomyces sp. XM4193]MCK1798202.1 asparaginase [Streptomyces sp. XM4193]